MRLAAGLIIEEGLEAEVRDALGCASCEQEVGSAGALNGAVDTRFHRRITQLSHFCPSRPAKARYLCLYILSRQTSNRTPVRLRMLRTIMTLRAISNVARRPSIA